MSEKELDFESNQLLITKIDLSGEFTYCNHNFIELIGHTEKELLGQRLQFVSHDDMPHGIDHLMWKTLKQKREFNFFIKLKTKQNNICWAFANARPFYNVTGGVSGYTCSLRAPNPAATMMFAMYYEQMSEIENKQKTDTVAQQSLELLNELLSATGDDYEASFFKLQFS